MPRNSVAGAPHVAGDAQADGRPEPDEDALHLHEPGARENFLKCVFIANSEKSIYM